MNANSDGWSAISIHAAPDESPGFLLWRNFMLWQRQLNAQLKPHGLTQPQFAVLAVCGWLTRDGESVSQQKIVDFLDMDRMHVSQIATRLEHNKLISREASTTDLRTKLVSLTPTGHSLLDRTMPIVEAFDQSYFANP